MDLDEQTEANARLQAELQKAGADNQQLKAKHEKDITIVTEELEDNKSVFVENHAADAASCQLAFAGSYSRVSRARDALRHAHRVVHKCRRSL